MNPEPKYELLQFFTYEHLASRLREVSRPFCDLAHELASIPEHEFRVSANQHIRTLLYCYESTAPCNTEASWATTKLSEASTFAANYEQEPHFVRLNMVLRKVLEAKDCAVRAVVFKTSSGAQ